jgi:hypothetical protein
VIFSLQALRALALTAGFPDPALAAAVAMAESSGNSCARGDPQTAPDCNNLGGPSTSFGLWQIHVPDHPEVDASRLFDPNYNAAAAFEISAQGTNWSPWTTFTSGRYLLFLSGSGPSVAGASSLRPVIIFASLMAAAAAGPTIRARLGR